MLRKTRADHPSPTVAPSEPLRRPAQRRAEEALARLTALLDEIRATRAEKRISEHVQISGD